MTERKKSPWYFSWLISAVVGVVLIISVPFIFVGALGYRTYKVSSTSMAPTLQQGDYIMVNPHQYDSAPPQRGDVVVLQRPDIKSAVVKRLVGLPGDTVEQRRDKLFLNSVEYPEPYARYVEGGLPEANFGPKTVPPGRYFFLGDSRDQSNDSRFWQESFLPSDRILGKVRYIYWSWNGFERVGMRVR